MRSAFFSVVAKLRLLETVGQPVAICKTAPSGRRMHVCVCVT